MQSDELEKYLKDIMAIVPKIHSEAGDPDADDDEVNTGGNGKFKIGDIWINTGDAGFFVCKDASEGAADWDEH